MELIVNGQTFFVKRKEVEDNQKWMDMREHLYILHCQGVNIEDKDLLRTVHERFGVNQPE